MGNFTERARWFDGTAKCGLGLQHAAAPAQRSAVLGNSARMVLRACGERSVRVLMCSGMIMGTLVLAKAALALSAVLTVKGKRVASKENGSSHLGERATLRT